MFGCHILIHVCIIGWSAKKKHTSDFDRIRRSCWGSLSDTTQKKFELPRWKGRRAGGSERARSFEKKVFFCFFQLIIMTCDLWNSTKKLQFEFLHFSEPPPAFSDQNSDLYQGVKKVQIAKIEFLFFKKNAIYGRSTTNSRPKNFFSSEKLI